MNDASRFRLALAKRVAPLYTTNPKIAALIVAGSVARGWADEFSDVELDAFWLEPPTDAERHAAVKLANGELIEWWEFQDDEWEESYLVSSVKVEVSHFLVSTIHQHIADVIERYDTNVGKQLRLAALQTLIPLHGAELIQMWRAKIVSYPDELVRRIIAEQIEFGGWNMVELLIERGDLLLAYDLTVKVQKQVLAVLLTLNRTYMAHPRGKWLEHVAAGMELKPPRLAERMRYALCTPSVEGVREMHEVIEETFALVDRYTPQVDTTAAKRDARYRRRRVKSAIVRFA